MNEKIILDIAQNIKIEAVWTLVVSGLIFYVLIVIKDFLMTLMKYFKFKGNQYVSIGTMVNVNDFIGRIKKIGIGFIIIEGEKGYYRISMENWTEHKWIFLRTQMKINDSIDGKRLGLRNDDDIKIDRNSEEYKELINKKEKL